MEVMKTAVNGGMESKQAAAMCAMNVVPGYPVTDVCRDRAPGPYRPGQ